MIQDDDDNCHYDDNDDYDYAGDEDEPRAGSEEVPAVLSRPPEKPPPLSKLDLFLKSSSS